MPGQSWKTRHNPHFSRKMPGKSANIRTSPGKTQETRSEIRKMAPNRTKIGPFFDHFRPRKRPSFSKFFRFAENFCLRPWYRGRATRATAIGVHKKAVPIFAIFSDQTFSIFGRKKNGGKIGAEVDFRNELCKNWKMRENTAQRGGKRKKIPPGSNPRGTSGGQTSIRGRSWIQISRKPGQKSPKHYIKITM